ncbi:MAG: response regulator, partial [Endomicrobiia bacterium]
KITLLCEGTPNEVKPATHTGGQARQTNWRASPPHTLAGKECDRVAKILIADDDIEIQELLTFTLQKEGYEVITASDGEEAIKKTIEEKPDLVILDVILPRLSGYEVCEKLRENPSTSLIPIIMLTSLTHAKDRIAGIKLGADEYLSKPFEPYELVARIEGLLRRLKKDISVNPLTGLQGIVAIEEEIKTHLSSGEEFAIFYLDIDNFSAYNEKYGFEKGNNLIKSLSNIIRHSVKAIEKEKGFIGHILGDDFVLVVSPYNIEELAEKIIELFSAEIIEHYDEEVRKEGFFNLVDKEGKLKKVPIATLSIGIGIIIPWKYKHPLEVIEYAKHLWKIAKTKQENSYVIG